jgi:hypothetical protein
MNFGVIALIRRHPLVALTGVKSATSGRRA